MIPNFLYLIDQDNQILSGTLTGVQNINSGRGSTWAKKVEQLAAEYNLDITKLNVGQENENFRHQLLSHKRLMQVSV